MTGVPLLLPKNILSKDQTTEILPSTQRRGTCWTGYKEMGVAELGHTDWAPREGGSILFYGGVYLIMILFYGGVYLIMIND